MLIYHDDVFIVTINEVVWKYQCVKLSNIEYVQDFGDFLFIKTEKIYYIFSKLCSGYLANKNEKEIRASKWGSQIVITMIQEHTRHKLDFMAAHFRGMIISHAYTHYSNRDVVEVPKHYPNFHPMDIKKYYHDICFIF